MGLSLVHSRGCTGVEAPLITVEVHLSGGLPSMHMVGLPETAVRESKDRVRAAMINSGFTNVASLEGGMMAWNGADLPVSRPH